MQGIKYTFSDPTTIWDINTARTNSNENMSNPYAGPK